MIRIALLFALPQEYAHFKRLMGSWRLRSRKPFKSYLYPKEGRGKADGKELILLETGMGHKRTIEGLEWLLEWWHPDMVVAVGFAGSLTTDLTVGDVCWGEIVVPLDCRPGAEMERRLNLKTGEGFVQLCREHRIRRTRIVTATQPKPKQPLSVKFSDFPSIMDMETYYVARFCCRNRLPFCSLRAISDGLWDEIDFNLRAISDAQGRVKIPLVLASVLKEPQLLKSYHHSWKRSRIAAGNLGKALCGFLQLPPAEIRNLVSAGGEW